MSLIRPSSHVTGDAGERIFQAAIPDAWVAQKQTPDYGIDFFVMVPEAHLVTSVRVGIQLKTTAKRHHRVAGALRVEVETRHLDYWLNQEVHPVFLVACDLADRAAYFVDVDSLVSELRNAWGKQESVTVSIPEENLVAHSPVLLSAIRVAWERRMGPHAAIRRRQNELQKVDPRFSVRITATDAGEFHELVAREPVVTTLRVNASGSGKVARLVRGYRVNFGPGEISMDDMPLWKALTDVGGVVEIARKTPAPVSILASSGQREARLANIPATIVRGMQALRLEGTLPGTPLAFELESNDADMEREHLPARLTIGLDGPGWMGRRLNDLPLFEQLYDFFDLCRAGANVQVLAHVPGTDVLAGEQRIAPGAFDPPWELLGLLRLARDVCRDAGVNPTLPESVSAEEEEEIRRLHGLLFRGEYRAPGGDWSVTVTGKAARRVDRHTAGDVAISMKMPEVFPFLGESIRVNMREVLLTKAVMTTSRPAPSGATTFTFRSKDGEFVQRSDRFTAVDVSTA